MRGLWLGLVFLMMGVGGLGAQRFQPGDTLTLWYRDIGQASGYYQGLFMVDTVTANFYFFSEQRRVETGQTFGSLQKGYFGALVGTKPYFVSGGQWFLDASYDTDLSTPALSEMFGFGFSDRALIFGIGGNQLVKGPLTPAAVWTDAVILDEPFVALTMAPLTGTVRSRNAYLYLASSHTLYESFRGNLQQIQLVNPDLFVDDRFEGDFPYQDAGTFAAEWTVLQGTASEENVIMGGATYAGVLAEAGASFEKAFSLALQEVPFAVDLELGVTAGDVFWMTLGGASGAVFRVGMDRETLKVEAGGQTYTLGSVDVGSVRIPVRIAMEIREDGGNTILSYAVAVQGVSALSGEDTLGNVSLTGADRVRFDVVQGRLFLDGVRIAPFYTRLTGTAVSSPELLVLTRGGVLYKKDASGWSVVAQGVPQARWFKVSEADPAVIWMVAEDGSLYRSSDGGATWNSIALPGQATEARDVAVSRTQVDSILVGTDAGLFVSGDGGATWEDLTGQFVRFDPEPWVRDVKSVLWEGGDEALVATGGSFFYTTAGLNAFAEFDAGLEPTYVAPEQLAGLVQVLEESSAFSQSGLWSAVQNLVGGLGSDVDNDPRIGVILTDISHQLTSDSRVPLIDVVDAELMDPASPYYNGMECMVFDVNYAGTLVDFTQPEDPADVQVPHALDGVVRNLARLVVLTHRPDEEAWVVEGLTEVVLRALRDGVAFDQVDATPYTFPALPGSYRMDVWPSSFGSPDQPWVLRRFLYAFFKYLAGNYGVGLSQLFTSTGTGGKAFIEAITGQTFDEVFLGFVRSAFLGEIALLPEVNVESFGTSYSSKGSGGTEISNVIPYSFRVFKIYNDYRFTQQPAIQIDSIKVNLNAPDSLQTLVLFSRQYGTTEDSLEVTALFEGRLRNDTTFQLGLTLYDTTDSPTDAILGDRVNLVFVRAGEAGRPVTGVTITLEDFTPPQVVYGFVQDPLADTRAIFYVYADEPVYAERPEENAPLPVEGPWFVEVEQNEFGLYDTGATHMTRATASLYYDGVFYEKVADLLSDKKWITIMGEDRFGNAFPTIRDSMVLWTLRAGTAATVIAGEVRLEVPAEALDRDARVLVRTLDPEDPWARTRVEGQLMDVVRLYQVGSASIRFQRPVTLTLRLPDEAVQQEVRVFRQTEGGWEEVFASRVTATEVEIVTDRLGLYAVTLAGGGWVPQTFEARMARRILSSSSGGDVRMQLALPEGGEVRFELYNALGQRITVRRVRLAAGVHTLRVEQPLLPGAYFLKVVYGDHRVVDRFVVVP